VSNVQEINRDALLQFYILSLLDKLRDTGIVRTYDGRPVPKLLSQGERKIVKEAERLGLCSFQNDEVMSSYHWVQAGVWQTTGALLIVDWKALLEKVK
jgi:hypothetical protein